MKVICMKVPSSHNGEALESSPWVTLDAEYHVVSVLAEPTGRVQIQIVTDDGRSLAWFDSTDFMTVDGTVPDSWRAQIGEGGVLELAPATWLAAGFWEAYYDADLSAVETVESELSNLHGEGPT